VLGGSLLLMGLFALLIRDAAGAREHN